MPTLPQIDGWRYPIGAEGRDEPFGAVPDRTFWRYYFAGQALAVADLHAANAKHPDWTEAQVANLSVAIADAMLAKLESEDA